MSVVCKRTLVLKECSGKKAQTAADFNGEARAFLNCFFNKNEVVIKLTFINDFDFSNAEICFSVLGQTRAFDIGRQKNDFKQKSFEFVFDKNEENFKLGEALPENEEDCVSALVFLNGEPHLFGYSAGKSGAGAFKIFAELNEFYEKNNAKKVDDGANETNVFYKAQNEFGKTTDNGDKPIVCDKNEKNSTDSYGGDSEQGIGETVNKYDDEALALENYFEKEREFLRAEQSFAMQKRVALYASESFSALGGVVKNDLSYNQNANANGGDCSSQSEKTSGCEPCKNESSAELCQERNFFERVKEELEKLFDTYPQESALCDVVPESDWVKIRYEKDKFYVVGIIKSGGEPQYIAYGVAGNRLNKPRGLSEYSLFLPRSLFSRGDDGYWCLLQNAFDGKTENLPCGG